MNKQWYVVHTYSGYENKVKTSLDERLNVSGLRERVGPSNLARSSKPPIILHQLLYII
jgi:transcription antitermination factor NusG